MNLHHHGNAGCIVKQGHHILVVKLRETGKWDIPAGKPLAWETAAETAKRETLEETGVSVYITRLLQCIEEANGDYFYLYEAFPEDMTIPLNTPLHFIPNSQQEIMEARFLPINTLNSSNFRYSDLLPIIVDLFQRIDCI